MRVIRSAGQNVSPSDDGRLFDQAFTDGLFEDATIVANGGNTISLSALYGIICGRDFTAEAQTISAVLPQTDTATGYVYVEFDTSSDDIITIGTALAPFTPTYENINTNGAVVQMVIAEYTASAVAVTSVTPTYVKASAGGVGSLAMIEASPATANHAVGTYLVYNGILYSVTSAIAVGETLVVGTNISEAKVGDALSELKSGLTAVPFDLTFAFSDASSRSLGVYYPELKLAVVSVNLYSPSGSIPKSGATVATIPQEYAPKSGTGAYAMANLMLTGINPTNRSNLERAYITDNGTMALNNFLTGATACYVMNALFVYLTN